MNCTRAAVVVGNLIKPHTNKILLLHIRKKLWIKIEELTNVSMFVHDDTRDNRHRLPNDALNTCQI